MTKELNENSGFKISIKTLIAIGAVMATVIGMWFVLQADINEAKNLPANDWNPEWLEKLPPPSISRMEFDMKDQLVRQTIMDTQKDVEEIKKTLEKIEDKLYGR